MEADEGAPMAARASWEALDEGAPVVAGEGGVLTGEAGSSPAVAGPDRATAAVREAVIHWREGMEVQVDKREIVAETGNAHITTRSRNCMARRGTLGGSFSGLQCAL